MHAQPPSAPVLSIIKVLFEDKIRISVIMMLIVQL